MNESSANEPSRHGTPSDLAGREVPVEDSPVPAGPATVPVGARPWQGPGRLVLHGAPHASLVFRGALGAGFLVVLICAVPQLLAGVPPLEIAFVLVPPTLIGTLILAWVWYRQAILARVTFDREAGLLMLGWKGLRGRRPLSSVIGIQVMQTRKQFGGPGSNIPALTMYQLNLILDDPAERRLNVMTCDVRIARSNARQVADFLCVPVLDCVGPPAVAAAAAEPLPVECWVIQSPVVTEPGPDVLLIRPRRLAFLGGGQGLGIIGAVLLLALVTGGVAGWVIVALVGAPLCFHFLVPNLLSMARFDRAQGLLTLGQLGRRKQRPLESVKAVEVGEGAFAQLNLVPDDPSQPRINLILGMGVDVALVRRAAERVASFLGVPLLHAGQQTPTAAPSGEGEPVNPLEALNRSSLPHGSASVRGPACVVAKGEDVLVLRTRSPFTWVWLVPAVLTMGLEIYLVWSAWLGLAAGGAGLQGQATWLLIVLLGALSQFSLLLKPLLLYRDHFDRQAGLLTLGWVGLKGTHPLAKVLAVQLVPGGLVDKAPAPFGRGGERVSYQLNLVMADTYQDRLNLTNDSDLKWTRQAGQQVADFLGVPVIDQIADGD
jgi:hypothetical protein